MREHRAADATRDSKLFAVLREPEVRTDAWELIHNYNEMYECSSEREGRQQQCCAPKLEGNRAVRTRNSYWNHASGKTPLASEGAIPVWSCPAGAGAVCGGHKLCL